MNPNAAFERDLERWLQAEAPASAPAGLHAAVIDRAKTMRQRPGWVTSRPARWLGRGRGRGMILFAAAALLIVGGAVAAAGSGLLRLPSVVPPQPVPSLVAIATASPDASPPPAPSPSPSGVQPRAASWTATGSMITPREGHTATLLPDGKVLVTGGLNRTSSNLNGTILASAELYDPGSGTWSATGSMSTARENHTATLLPDGKVLVVGGFTGTGGKTAGTTLASAELYDPGRGSWSATGSMSTARESHRATLLPDGEVLVVGGFTVSVSTGTQPGYTVSTDQPLVSAELYDPASGTWTATGKMVSWTAAGTIVNGGGTATLLPDGKVLVAGGNSTGGSFGGTGFAGDTSELYEPSNGTWTLAGKMVAARGRSMATLLPDGKVLVAGGLDAYGRASELFDPSTGSWTATGTMVAGHSNGAATLLPDGMVLVTGIYDPGYGNNAIPETDELYDPGSGTWTATASLATPRSGHTATLLPNGKVLVAGGSAADGRTTLPSAELYDPGTGQ